VKLGVSTRERAAIAAVMHRGQWGGDRAVLLAQAGVYRALKLGEFIGKDGAALARTSLVDRTVYELPDGAGDVLAAILSAGGQSAEIALLNAGVLERLDPVAAAAAELGRAEEVTAVTPPASGALPTNNKHKRKGAQRL
jgi:hypothetical protein